MRAIKAAISVWLLLAGAGALAQVPPLHSVTDEFDRFATRTERMPQPERVRAFRAEFEKLVPGFYQPRFGRTEAQYDEHIAKGLAYYPQRREQFLRTSRDFGAAYEAATTQFRAVFPDYNPTIPIYLLHSFGEMDGGTRTVDGRTVAVFGADVIARIHDEHTLAPFLTHELFHFYHGQYFKDCEAIWCQVWGEGLAVYVTSQMFPGADDRALALTMPRPIRPEVEPRLKEAMCLLASNLDSEDEEVYGSYFFGNGRSAPYPPRYGYFLGYLAVQKVAEGRTLQQLAQMPGSEVKPLIEKALAGFDC